MFRKTVLLVGLLALVLAAFPAVGFAQVETFQQTFEHKLGIGASPQSYEHRIDLPQAWSQKNLVFVRRVLSLTGKLVIEREELTATYYYVKVRLPKAVIWTAKGSLAVTLEGFSQPSTAPAPEAPSRISVGGPGLTPIFLWDGLGKYTAITLLDRANNQNIWERVIVSGKKTDLDEGRLHVGGHYLWAVRQSDETAKYSAEAGGAFKIGQKTERCSHCFGTGYVTCTACGGSGQIVSAGPNGVPVYHTCYQCNGSGRERCSFCNGMGTIQVPVVIPE
ncbi:MAG: hypothetical protein WA705_30530 [Candidatus Ozemobacteraceae bacterium]